MSAAGFEPLIPASERPQSHDRRPSATGTVVNGVGPIGLTYRCYNFLFYGMSPTSKPTAIATQIYPER